MRTRVPGPKSLRNGASPYMLVQPAGRPEIHLAMTLKSLAHTENAKCWYSGGLAQCGKPEIIGSSGACDIAPTTRLPPLNRAIMPLGPNVPLCLLVEKQKFPSPCVSIGFERGGRRARASRGWPTLPQHRTPTPAEERRRMPRLVGRLSGPVLRRDLPPACPDRSQPRKPGIGAPVPASTRPSAFTLEIGDLHRRW